MNKNEIEITNFEEIKEEKSSDQKNFLEVPIKNYKYFKRHFGNNLVCFFHKGEPLLTIGPHCFIFFFFKIRKYIYL